MARTQVEPVLVEVMKFASDRHRDQRRKDVHQSPYITHPIEVWFLLTSMAGVIDAATLCAAILHDILEDTSTRPDEIEHRFGDDVLQLVEEVTDPPGLTSPDRRQRQLSRVATSSPRARLIRLADKVASLGALPSAWGPAERRAYLTWMGEMAVALAGTNAALEAEMATRLKVARKSAHHAPSAPRPEQPPEAPAVGLKPEFGDELAKLVRRLQKQLSDAEELSDTLSEMLLCLGVNLMRRTPATPRPGPALARKKRGLFSDPIFEELARNGVGTVTFKDGKPRARLVSIDGARPFELPAGAAVLLQALVSVPGCADDGFAPPVSHSVLADVIERISGRRPQVHTVVVALGRLKEKLFLAKWSPKLIETEPGRGVRFRQRRSS